MKNIHLNSICLLFFITASFISQAQKKELFIINGNINGLSDTTWLYLIKETNNTADTIASLHPSNGHFSIKGNVPSETEWYFIKKSNTKEYVRIFLDNEAVSITGTLTDWPNLTITGSISHEEYKKFTLLTTDLNKKLQTIKSEKAINEEDKKNNYERSLAVRDEIMGVWKNYILQHPNSSYAAFLLSQSFFSLQEKEHIYNKLSKKIQQSKYGKKVVETIGIEKRTSMIKLNAISPDFTSFTPEGKKVSLKEIVAKNKLTLIDFWASWCHPCRDEIPNMKKVYEAFHDKGFNILGVSLEYKADAWKKAIREEAIPWPVVSQVKGREEDAANIFAINGVPAYVLLDNKGRIISLDLPGSAITSGGVPIRGEELYKTIEDLLGNQVKNKPK